MTTYVYETKVTGGGVDSIEFSPYLCDSMEDAINLSEAEYNGPKPLIWDTPPDTNRGRFLTGSFTDDDGERREVKIARRAVRSTRTITPDPNITRQYRVKTSAYREFLGVLRRNTAPDDTRHVWTASCRAKGCEWQNSSEAWDEVRAQKALTSHHVSKHGLAKEHA